MTKREEESLKELIRLCNQRDEEAWQELIALVQPKILATCRRMRLSREESLDVFGQVCYILLEHLRELKHPDKLISYVITTARRQALSHDRKARLLERVEQEAWQNEPPESPTTPEGNLEAQEQADIVLRALARLSRREARLVQLLFLDPEEPTYEQISSRLQMPASSIGPTRSRVLTKLYRIMKQLGYKFLVF